MSNEISASNLAVASFIKKTTADLTTAVKDLNACILLSGGVASSALTVLAHRALKNQLKVFLIDNGMMRMDEPRDTFLLFKKLGIDVTIINTRKEVANALQGKTDPDAKREALLAALFNDTLSHVLKAGHAKYFLHTANADNYGLIGLPQLMPVFKRSGQDPQNPFGSIILEPLAKLKRDALQKLGRELKLSSAHCNALHFPFTGLAGRVLGDASSERVEIIRRVTTIVDSLLTATTLSHRVAVLHQEKIGSLTTGKNAYGMQVELRAWEITKAKTSQPARIPAKLLDTLTRKIISGVPGVVSVTYNITPLPPAVAEAI